MARKAGLDRAMVIATAARLADRDGLEALTLSQLAAELGVRSPSLYAHVDGLAGLHRALGIVGAEAMTVELQTAVAKRRGAPAARAFAAALRRFAHEHPGLYAATSVAAAPGDEEHGAALAAPVEVAASVLRGLDVRENQLIHMARTWRASLHGFVALERAGGFGLPVDIEASFRRMVDVLIAGMVAAN
jgi:AcrR family transcriptional regulator